MPRARRLIVCTRGLLVSDEDFWTGGGVDYSRSMRPVAQGESIAEHDYPSVSNEMGLRMAPSVVIDITFIGAHRQERISVYR